MEQLTAELGRVLRRARMRRGLTLRQVETASGGRHKPSSIAGYERGERQITVERFCRLAAFYGEDPASLLAEALAATTHAEDGILIDLTRLTIVLPSLEEGERRAVERLVRERAPHEPPAVIRLDLQDLGALSDQAGRTARELLADLEAAIETVPRDTS